MEKFVDRIIETDRRAREIIESAQQEKDVLAKEAAQRAQAELAQRAVQQSKEIAQQDAALKENIAKADEQADRDYMTAKHLLDNSFAEGYDTWLAEIVAGCKVTAVAASCCAK